MMCNYRLSLMKPGLFLLSLFLLTLSCKIKAQSITLYSFPPPHPIRWSHPHSLLISTIRNYYARPNYKPVRMLGHFVLELKNDTSILLTGMAIDEMADLRKPILKDKIGLAVLFKLAPGHLEETAQVQTEINNRARLGSAAFITFKITDSAYQYLKLYIDSFKLKGYDKLYNGLNRPRAGEGSGCTAFGISFLELINALSPEYKDQWAIEVNIPEKLIGDSIAKKKVSVWRIFFSFRWAKKNKPARLHTLYEPSLIYQWINKVWDEEQKKPSGKYQLKNIGLAKGIEINCQDCIPKYPMFVK